MGNRLSKIYTRTGDDGTTGLATGERVSKDCLLIKVQGDLDELNSNIACILACNISKNIQNLLIAIQHHLFNIGGDLSSPECLITKSTDVEWLEKWIDHYNESLPPLKEFILPGGDLAVAHCHVARTVCRRAERHLVEWSQQHEVRSEIAQYINRLSDLLFVLARVIEKEKNISPSHWDKNFPVPEPK